MINIYSLRFNENKLPYLYKETSVDYMEESRMQTPKAIVDMVNNCFDLKHLVEEHVIMIALNAQKHIIGLFNTSHGSLISADCSPNNIIKRALLCSAATIIVAHNHPSGDVTPSFDDIQASHLLQEAGALIGIKLDDFIIIGENEYFSFYEEKLLLECYEEQLRK